MVITKSRIRLIKTVNAPDAGLEKTSSVAVLSNAHGAAVCAPRCAALYRAVSSRVRVHLSLRATPTASMPKLPFCNSFDSPLCYLFCLSPPFLFFSRFAAPGASLSRDVFCLPLGSVLRPGRSYC